MKDRGLKISREKNECFGCNEHRRRYIHLQGETVKRVVIQIGSLLAQDGVPDAEVTY